jgi:hypothetical protein
VTGCKKCRKKGKMLHMHHHWELELPPKTDKLEELEVRMRVAVKDAATAGKDEGERLLTLKVRLTV